MEINKSISAGRINISGVVQGVGFRPFLFQLAHDYGFNGEVSNTSRGVRLVVEGNPEKMDDFCRDIVKKHPPLASVCDLQYTPVPVRGYIDFTICTSHGEGERSALISPDVSVCDDCLKEMTDPTDRRFEYPFINCTNCGPRYTIIKDIPYDRPKTAMASFPMCPACRKEYDDPMNRRFHAQPNACPVCGPHTFLVDAGGRPVDCTPGEAVEKAALLLKQGHIVAIKGLGGFHLAVDAACHPGVTRLREAKKRPDKPFALMARCPGDAACHVVMTPEEERLLTSRHRPIVLLQKRRSPGDRCLNDNGQERGLHGALPLSDAVAPDNPFLGVMLPYTPLHYLLLEKGPSILVMTSGNPGGEPLSIDNDHALAAFSHMADYFLLHNRDIYFRADDSIMQVQENVPRFFRRSRGYAPMPVFLKQSMPRVLACGGGLKSTLCLTRENRAFLSQHIGDLDNEKVFHFYKTSVDHLKRILDISPDIIAHDLHPGYMSTSWAGEQQGMIKVGVQHHHAHAVSCMAENGIVEPVIAVTLDGTGLGSDGAIWGGEVLTCTLTDFQRRAHLKYIPMPGGDAAVLEPWRMAAAYLWHIRGNDFLDLKIPLIQRLGRAKLNFVATMMTRGVNCPLTSSCGRLFDAVASLLGLRDKISFEGQAAMNLQAMSHMENKGAYGIEFNDAFDENGQSVMEMDLAPAFIEMLQEMEQGLSCGSIGGRFHETVIEAFSRAVLVVSDKTGICKVVLSGGVFNNGWILSGILKRLEDQGLKVYTHEKVPAGDGGISLGQAVIAGQRAKISE
ncbi:Hydrogenase maturation protein, carbamoyltransferase HypF [Desulfocicer vacuolatum DSM 3385]|uniref:Carbamoyltransferase n=1 Tax=Desulfocicer vacuolatum DSM 3385 TaxID=1121400 RepID=A0A1W1YPK8_9BACT|nr:carbamoyltransferase HypF [Desulfocicer vacuolatum]SMC37668.1 Hydrogenase maturation protein, carbamoyltransferase HypF [Desulfocicer vacuolatum DSM 3385]